MKILKKLPPQVAAKPAAETAAGDPPAPKKGARVWAKWKDGEFYKGTVGAIIDGKARIIWDDGGTPMRVSFKNIKPLQVPKGLEGKSKKDIDKELAQLNEKLKAKTREAEAARSKLHKRTDKSSPEYLAEQKVVEKMFAEQYEIFQQIQKLKQA